MDLLNVAKTKLDEIAEKNNLPAEEYEELKKLIYFSQLERYIQSIYILLKSEEKMLQELDNLDIKDITNIHKSIVKSMDSISSSLRQFEPSLKSPVDISEAVEELHINEDDDVSSVLTKIMQQQVLSLVKSTYEIQQNMDKYKVGSLDHWKSSEALKGLSALVLDMAKTIQKLKESGVSDDEFDIESIISAYKQMKEI